MHKTLQELRMLSSVTPNCKVTMIVMNLSAISEEELVMNSGSQLFEITTSSQAMSCHVFLTVFILTVVFVFVSL